jgi:hypothetical protein
LVIFIYFIEAMGIQNIVALVFVKIKNYSVIFTSFAKVVAQ